jgi:hypothetical protein
MHQKKSGIFSIWPFVICLSAGIYFISLNVTGYSFTHYPGDLGDGRLNNYFLEHAHKYLTGQIGSFWDAPFMYPEEKVLSYSDNLIGSAPFYSIFRLNGFDRETSYQLWFITMAALAFICCYYLLILLFKDIYAAAIGAFIFAFSMALQSQITHAQTFPRFPIPMAFAMFIIFTRNFRPVFFFLSLMMVVYQLYCGIYLGLMLIIPMLIFIILFCICEWKNMIAHFRKHTWLFKIILALVINMLLLLPLVLPYIARSKMVGMNDYQYVLPTVPTPVSHFYSQPGSLLWDFLSGAGKNMPAFWDHQIFAGGFATLSFICAVFLLILGFTRKEKSALVKSNPFLIIFILTGLISLALFIRFESFSLYRIAQALPGFGSMRSLTRIINIELVFFAASAALIVHLLLQKMKKARFAGFIILAMTVLADNYFKPGMSYSSEKKISQSRVNLLIEKMKDIPENSVVSYEPDNGNSDFVAYQIDAMLAAQSLNLVTVNGYTATSPGEYTPYWMNLDSLSRESWFKAKNLKINKLYVIH